MHLLQGDQLGCRQASRMHEQMQECDDAEVSDFGIVDLTIILRSLEQVNNDHHGRHLSLSLRNL